MAKTNDMHEPLIHVSVEYVNVGRTATGTNGVGHTSMYYYISARAASAWLE